MTAMVPTGTAASQMDDKHGNVIDGTERARQWRRSRPKSGTAAESTQTRADAPKSIAGSLLVPAEMLSSAIPPDEHLNGSEHGRVAAPIPRANAGAGEPASPETGAHQNPFLVPEAARVEHRSRSTRRRMIAALLASPRGLISARRRSSRPLRRHVAMPRWLGEPRPVRLLALVALISAVLVTVLIITRPNAAHPSYEPALRAAGPLNTPERGALTAQSNPLAQQAAAHDRVFHRVRRVRAHRTVGTHRRPRPASRSVVVPARYTPPASKAGSSAVHSTTPSSSSSGAAAATTQPVPPTAGGTTSGSASSASSRPAFGQNGTLGPGHSPSS
jgi:hypothetical protein